MFSYITAPAWISLAFQGLCSAACIIMFCRLFGFYFRAYGELRKVSESAVWPAVSFAYGVASLLLVVTNVWFLPNFSSSVLSILPALAPNKAIIIYATHSLVISAFVINYAHSTQILQELEHGRYEGDAHWGRMIRASGRFIQMSDAISRLLVGAAFIWLEASLWHTGRFDLATMAPERDWLDPPNYRQLLSHVADAAMSVYVAMALWTTVTFVATVLHKERPHFRAAAHRRAIFRQMRLTAYGALICSYTAYLARGDILFFRPDDFPGSIDSDYVFMAAIPSAAIGLMLTVEISIKLIRYISAGELFGMEVS